MEVESIKELETRQEESKEETKPCTFSREYYREMLADLLRIYYSRIFPYRKFYEWLAYGKRKTSINDTHRQYMLDQYVM